MHGRSSKTLNVNAGADFYIVKDGFQFDNAGNEVSFVETDNSYNTVQVASPIYTSNDGGTYDSWYSIGGSSQRVKFGSKTLSEIVVGDSFSEVEIAWTIYDHNYEYVYIFEFPP